MFTTTLRSQPVYSRSRLSEFVTAREPGRINETDPDNARDRDTTFVRWFRCLTGPPTYLYDATVPSFFFYAHAKWKAQMTGINPDKSHGQGPWVSHERHRLDDCSSPNRRRRSCSILLLEDGDYRRAKASAHKARVTDCVLDDLDVSPPSPYILG